MLCFACYWSQPWFYGLSKLDWKMLQDYIYIDPGQDHNHASFIQYL